MYIFLVIFVGKVRHLNKEREWYCARFGWDVSGVV